jgi:hypothetical protein
VLVAGGAGNLTSAELYDPATGLWTSTGFLTEGRYYHSATLLPNGKVLVAAGYKNPTALSSVEIYDPGTGGWSAGSSLASPHTAHTATLLPAGRVLIAGGGSGLHLYDPGSGTWSNGGPLIQLRFSHTATLLASGKVLVAAGYNTAYLNSAELFDPGLGFSGTWQPQMSAASLDAGGRLVLTGTGFRGISSASGGNGSQDSPTNHPVVQLRRLDNEQTLFLLADPTTPVSATAFTSVPVPSFPGHVMVTLFANGIPSPALLLSHPDIAVEQPAGSLIADGGTRNLVTVPGTPVSVVFTIRNPSNSDVIGLTITTSPTSPVVPGGSTTFTVQFAPATIGAYSAALHSASNVAGKNPYDINLTGQTLLFTADTDGDGLNDASEFLMASLGFNWQVGQPALVTTLKSNLNGAGYYTTAQVQALNIGTPLLQASAGGVFTLTIGVEKSTNLINFAPFPMSDPQTLINGAGKLEFVFTVPDNAVFFRLQSQ